MDITHHSFGDLNSSFGQATSGFQAIKNKIAKPRLPSLPIPDAASNLRAVSDQRIRDAANSNSVPNIPPPPPPPVVAAAAPLAALDAPTVKPIIQEIKELFDMGKQNRAKLLNYLLENDVLDSSADPLTFQCPMDESRRLEPTLTFNATRAASFRTGAPDSWIFYQHLRKAGGTGFCELTKSNMPRSSIPPYYCMPDNKGSLATPPWKDEAYLLRNLRQHGYRIASNEWDAYQDFMGSWAGAVYITTFRDPFDRWYSQYKFEHLERRDGQPLSAPRKPMRTWYGNNRDLFMGNDYYIKTFIGTVDEPTPPPRVTNDFYWTYRKFNHLNILWDIHFMTALNNLKKFNLILVLDLLDNTATHEILDRVLGWKTPPKRVRPHENQAPKRGFDKAEEVAKRSSSGSSLLRHKVPEEDYLHVAQDNVFDMLFYRVARRLFMERYACGAY